MPFKNPHPLYNVWYCMRERCRNQNNRQWKDYGGRGIRVCERWNAPKGEGFRNFLADMGPRPEGRLLDRKNNDGNYSPDNCRWASRQEQQRNQRVTRKIIVGGVEFVAADLAGRARLKTDTIVYRASLGLSLADVLSQTPRRNLSGLALGGDASGARQRAKTHCPHGHEYNALNTYVTPEGYRRCRRCRANGQARAS